MVNETLVRAEQEVIYLEQRYSNSIQALRPQLSRLDPVMTIYRRERYALLGQIDGVPIVEVDRDRSRKGEEDKVEKRVLYGGSEYAWVCSNLPWYGYSPMRRAVRLNSTEMPHVFGIVEASEDTPTEIGIYIPQETLALARRRHAEEVLKDYPAIQIDSDQLKGLNISPDFVFRIETEVALETDKSELSNHGVIVKPVVDGREYNDGNYGLPKELTEFQIRYLEGPRVSLADFFAGRRDGGLEALRESIGATCYLSFAEYDHGLRNYSFRFNRVLSNQEIAAALQKLGKAKDSSYLLTLFRLSDQLRELVNVPLDQAIPSPLVKRYVEEDFPADQSSGDERYLSLSMF